MNQDPQGPLRTTEGAPTGRGLVTQVQPNRLLLVVVNVDAELLTELVQPLGVLGIHRPLAPENEKQRGNENRQRKHDLLHGVSLFLECRTNAAI